MRDKLNPNLIGCGKLRTLVKRLAKGWPMGRGRQKAKHTKVARELKYYSPETDLSQLEKELTGAQEERSQSEELGDYEEKEGSLE